MRRFRVWPSAGERLKARSVRVTVHQPTRPAGSAADWLVIRRQKTRRGALQGLRERRRSSSREPAPLARFHVRAAREDAEFHGRACAVFTPHGERASHELRAFAHPGHAVVAGSLLTREPSVGAGLWNIITALEQIHLSAGTALSYMRQLRWDASMQQDRLFGLADLDLLNQIKIATAQGMFAPEVGPGLFHPGATSSFKQLQFGEANVQVTFHENADTPGGMVGVEVDMDYFRDQGAHAIIEVVPNLFTRGLTDPKRIYLLRWIAGRQAGVPDFAPPFTIEA